MTSGEVAQRLERLSGTGVRDLHPAGSAHRWRYYRAALADGRAVFAKVAAAGLAGLFDAEARGYFAGRHVRSCAGMPGSAASSSASPVVAARTRSNASA